MIKLTWDKHIEYGSERPTQDQKTGHKIERVHSGLNAVKIDDTQ